jgi:glucose-1-phosphate thymidylyltransferase
LAMSVQQGVILAAGRGSRLQPLSTRCPKPILPVGNKPVMQHHLEWMRDVGITEIAVVLGPTSESIAQYFGTGASLGVSLHYIFDPEPAGIATSLARAESWLRGSVVVALGDVFVASHGRNAALTQFAATGAAASFLVRRDTADSVRRNFAVVADIEGRVRRVVEKPTAFVSDLKGCGIYIFAPVIFDAIRRTPRSVLRNEVELTDAVQKLVDMDQPVYAVEITGWDVNITFPRDLLVCNLKLLKDMKANNLIGKGASIAHETNLDTCIVGSGARVDAGVVLKECLVFAGVRVPLLSGNLHRAIVTSQCIWRDPQASEACAEIVNR